MSLMEHDAALPVRKTKRRVMNGSASNDLVFSAMQGVNFDIFPSIAALYIPRGGVVADITYGKGVFWRNINTRNFILKKSDLATGTDCRNLRYKDSTIDSVVFDPPYMHTPGGSAHVGHQNYEHYYRNNGSKSEKKYHEAVLDLYFKTAKEAWRVLRDGGTFIVKCQDEVCANQQRLTHVEIINEYQKLGFCVEDLFVLMSRNRPGMSRVVKQVHARKNHSYFIVFWKRVGKKRWKGPQQVPSIS